MTLRTSRTRADDDGLTLIELIVYIVVGGILLGIVGTIFVTTMQANATTGDRDLSTGRAQVVSTDLSTTLRNAYALREKKEGSVRILRAALASDGGTCRAWATVGGNVITTTYGPLNADAAPPADPNTWGQLASGVTATFTATGDKLLWTITAENRTQPNVSEGAAATLSGAAVASAEGTSPKCW